MDNGEPKLFTKGVLGLNSKTTCYIIPLSNRAIHREDNFGFKDVDFLAKVGSKTA